jgi:hypothetical protein
VFSTASRAGDVASDAPVAPDDIQPGFRRADLRRTPDPLSPPSRQRRQLPPVRAPSIDECSLRPLARTSRGTRHRSHDFAVAIRLPAPVRPSTWERLDPLPFGKRPGAARRLLQSTQSASTTDRTVRTSNGDPALRPAPVREDMRIREQRWKTTPSRRDRGTAETAPQPAAAGLRLDAMSSGSLTMPRVLALARAHPLLRSDPAEVSRVRGQAAFAFPAPSVAIARNGSFAPTRSARTPAVVKLAANAGWRGRPRRAHTCLRVPMTSSPGGPACARPTRRPLF